MGSLLLRCDHCSEIMELQHLSSHNLSSCSKTEIPPTSKISLEQLLCQEIGDKQSVMEQQAMGMLAEKLFPSSGPLTCRTPKGKV